MPHRFLLAGLIACSLTSCALGPSAVREEWSPGVPRRVGTTEGGKQAGEWTYYDRQGRVEARGSWINDLQEGRWTFLHGDGSVRSEGDYVRGLRTGRWQQFHQGGQPAATGMYENDRQLGFWRYAWPTGRSYAHGWFEGGVRTAHWARYADNGALSESGCWWQGLKVGPHASWKGPKGVLKDLGVPTGMTAATREVGGLKLWVLSSSSSERLAYAHRGGIPRLLRAEGDGRQALARWDDQGRLRLAGERGTQGRSGWWTLFDERGRVVAEQAYVAGRIAGAADRAAEHAPSGDLLAEEQASAASSPLDEAYAALLADEQRLFDAPPSVAPPSAPPARDATSMTLTNGPVKPAPVAISEQQVDLTPVETGPVALSPADVLPRLWTLAQEGKAAKWIDRYTHRRDEDDGYGTRATPPAEGNALELVGKPMPQTRFLASDGNVLDLTDWRGQPVVVVVMRGFSGQVCLYCATQTAAISDNLERFTQANAKVVVVYPGPAESISAFVEAVQSLRTEPPPMPLCLDVSLLLVRSLAIEGNLAKPTSLVLDGTGVVRYAYVGKTIADRPSVDELVEAVERMGGGK